MWEARAELRGGQCWLLPVLALSEPLHPGPLVDQQKGRKPSRRAPDQGFRTWGRVPQSSRFFRRCTGTDGFIEPHLQILKLLRSSAQDRPVVTVASSLLPQRPFTVTPPQLPCACPEGHCAALSGGEPAHVSLGGGSSLSL